MTRKIEQKAEKDINGKINVKMKKAGEWEGGNTTIKETIRGDV
jgi:hypothetical protein